MKKSPAASRTFLLLQSSAKLDFLFSTSSEKYKPFRSVSQADWAERQRCRNSGR